LNNGHLRDWLHILATNTSASSRYYDDNSFLRQPEAYRRMMQCLAPLSPPSFPLLQLPLDYEAKVLPKNSSPQPTEENTGSSIMSSLTSSGFISSLRSSGSISNNTGSEPAHESVISSLFKKAWK